MPQNLTLLLCLCSLYGSAQLFVQNGTTLSLEKPQAILSSQEAFNQIDAPIVGHGTILLNSNNTQQLSSAQILELPTLHIQNAYLVQIQTTLNLQNQMFVDHGELILSHDLILRNPTALVLGTDASISLNSNGQIVYKTQLEESHPLALQPTLLIKYTRPKTPQERPQTAFIVTPTTSNFGSIYNADYVVYCTHLTPPPKVV